MVQAPEHTYTDTSAQWERARRRVERKHKFHSDLFAYVVINAVLIVAWAATGLGYFWPGWVLGVWGALLLLDAWSTYFRRPVSDAEVEKELRRSR